MLEGEDIEGLARWAYEKAGMDPWEPAGALELAGRLLGGDGPLDVYLCPELLASAALARVGSSWRFYVRNPRTERATEWLVWHELAEWILDRDGYREPDVEAAADRLAAALRAPRPAFLRAIRASGRSLPELAKAFGTSESSAALRFGEVALVPLALVAPRRPVRVRGVPDSWVASEAQIVRLVRCPAPGWERVPLSDQPGRVAVVAA